MNDIRPLHRCTRCERGVLNRRVSHCLYCGAQLPASALASPGEIAEADERERKARAHAASTPAPQAASNDIVRQVDDAADVLTFLARLLD